MGRTFFAGATADVQVQQVSNDTWTFCLPPAPPPPHCSELVPALPVVVQTGCHTGGAIGSACILTCEQGFQATDMHAGACVLALDGLSAEYMGQNVTCLPETLPDGSFSSAYCVTEANQIVSRDCCHGLSQTACAARPLHIDNCTVSCAEAFMPLWSQCQDHLANFNALSAVCQTTAETFLSGAPSSIVIGGFGCHSYATGQYVLENISVSAKSSWTMVSRGREFHLFFRESPDRWCFASNVRAQCFAELRSYESLPPWRASTWKEECTGGSVDAVLHLEPGYTADDCHQASQLITEEVHLFCCSEPTDCVGGAAPRTCGYDCSRVWYPFSVDCRAYLARTTGGSFDAFTQSCERRHTDMQVLSTHGSVFKGGKPFNTTFPATRDLEYKVEMLPGENLSLSAMQVIAPHSHHVMASRFDASLHSTGRKVLQWAATEDEAGVEISVEALAGGGDFELAVTVEGTIEHLAPELVTYTAGGGGASANGAMMLTHCEWADDCTFRYAGEEIRSSGNDFILRLHGAAGLTYAFSVDLNATDMTGTHFNIGIFHENAVGGSESAEPIQGADFALGQWTAAGMTPYSRLHNCTAADMLTRVPCGGDEGDIGVFRTHPGEGPFPTSHTFEWPCPVTGTFFVRITANCDIPYYSDTDRCAQLSSGEWHCPNAADRQCSSETRMRVDVRDKTTTVAERTLIEVPTQVLIPGSEAEAQFATMFTASQHPAIAYVTEILHVARGGCTPNPCQHAGVCVPMPPMNTSNSQVTVSTYHCDCSPTWTGAQCEEAADAAANMADLFQAHPDSGSGGGHRRRTQTTNSLAAVTVHATGQTPALAHAHLTHIHRMYDMSQLDDIPGMGTSGNYNGGHRRAQLSECNCTELEALRRENAALRRELAESRGQRENERPGPTAESISTLVPADVSEPSKDGNVPPVDLVSSPKHQLKFAANRSRRQKSATNRSARQLQQVTCSAPPVVLNGQWSLPSGGHGGDTTFLTCSAGALAVPTVAVLQCSFGVWIGSIGAECVLPTSSCRVDQLPVVPGGTWSPPPPLTTQYPLDATSVLSCASGQTSSVVGASVTCTVRAGDLMPSFQWTDNIQALCTSTPSPVPVDCSAFAVPDVHSGIYIASAGTMTYTEGATIPLTCQAGLVPSPAGAAIICSGGQWTGQATCVQAGAASCGDISSRTHAVNDACCRDTCNCVGGLPTTCSAGCAQHFLPFWSDCRDILQTSLSFFQPVLTKCQATVSTATGTCALATAGELAVWTSVSYQTLGSGGCSVASGCVAPEPSGDCSATFCADLWTHGRGRNNYGDRDAPDENACRMACSMDPLCQGYVFGTEHGNAGRCVTYTTSTLVCAASGGDFGHPCNAGPIVRSNGSASFGLCKLKTEQCSADEPLPGQTTPPPPPVGAITCQ
eukprot:COSAG01_NODE_4595_length_4890_cov_3.789814_2_plen_1402_part_01